MHVLPELVQLLVLAEQAAAAVLAEGCAEVAAAGAVGIPAAQVGPGDMHSGAGVQLGGPGVHLHEQGVHGAAEGNPALQVSGDHSGGKASAGDDTRCSDSFLGGVGHCHDQYHVPA